MTESDLSLLTSSKDRIVKITCYSGQVIIAKIRFIFEEYEDVVYDLVWTNRESEYEKHDEQPAYAIDFKDIKSVEATSPPKPGSATP